MRAWSMGLAATGCLYGAAGVALAAAGAHRSGDGALATTAAHFLLFHAAAIVALCAVAPAARLLNLAVTLLAVGVLLFSGELTLHALAGMKPLPIAAPTGGFVMIVGWLIAAVALPRSLAQRNARD